MKRMRLPTVLLAEDNLHARVETSARIWQAGLQVQLARHPGILRMLVDAARRPDLLVISAEFGHDTAGDWLSELSRHPEWSAVPVIAITGQPDSLFAQALGRAGMPVLSKPVATAALREALMQLGIAERAPAPALREAATQTLRAVEACRRAVVLRGARVRLGWSHDRVRPTLID
jgi:CheY-like chemotaxis protein